MPGPGLPAAVEAWWLKWRHVRAVAVVNGGDARYRLAMEFLVVPTYRCGVRLGRNALLAAKPIPGLLIIEDRPTEQGEEAVMRVARFRQAEAAGFPELLSPLFDPVLLRCDQSGILLGGFEAQVRRGGGRTLQAWWLRPFA